MKFILNIVSYMKDFYSPLRSNHRAYRDYDRRFHRSRDTPLYKLNLPENQPFLDYSKIEYEFIESKSN